MLVELRARCVRRAMLFLANRRMMLVSYRHEHRRGWLDAVSRIKRERTFLLSHAEACQIISALKATAKVPGCIAELGVAYGASAKLITDFAPERTVYLFDTFEGLPEPQEGDSEKFATGDFKSDIETVRKYLEGRRVVFHKGYFPETAGPVADKQFSFVHLDVDLYESTRSGLEFFYPRMSKGGIIITHDYMTSAGVNRAFDEFFTGKPEPVIELMGYQAMIVKM